jgi:PUA domain protein
MMKIKRQFIKEKEAKKLLSQFFKSMRAQSLEKIAKASVELAETNNEEIFLIDQKPVFAKLDEHLIPTLVASDLLSNLPRAIINMGAVPYVCNGADVMAPGIVSFEGEFDEGDIVIVADEQHQKPLAITVARCSIEEAQKLEKGKILTNVHYIGDKLWNIMKKL